MMTTEKKTVAILAAYPLHLIPDGGFAIPAGTFASWLPQLAEGFEGASDLDIHWITFSKAVKCYKKHTHCGQSFHVFPRGKTSIQIVSGYWAERRVIKNILGKIKPKVVHAWGTEEGYALAAGEFKGFSLLSMQGILQYYCAVAAKKNWLQWIQSKHERRAMGGVSMMTCESNWGIKVLQDLGVSLPIEKMEHGVHPSFYKLSWEPNKNKPVAFFAGSVDERKGVDDLLDVFGKETLSKFHLKIAGSGPLEKIFREKNLPNVELLGRLSREEMAEHLRQSWCLVLPTRADTSPNIVKEARVIGLPVITTPRGGQSDYIEPSKNGYLVEPGEIAELEKALRDTMFSIEHCVDMGAHLHQTQRDYFRSENTVNTLLNIYRKKGK